MPPKRGAPRPRSRSSARQSRENPPALEAAPVEIEIEDLSDFNESINILVHGPSGHGKTVLAGGAPNAVFLSTEKGVVSAKRSGSLARVVRAPDWEHIAAALNMFDDKLGPDDWLIVDSLTKMQKLHIRWILRMINQQNESRDLDIPAIQDHQKWQNGFTRFTDRMIDAPYNTIFVTTSMVKDDPEGEPMVMPDIVGKDYTISNYVSAQMDVILYYAVAKQNNKNAPPVRRALAQPYPPWIAKDRFSALGRWQDVEDGDYTAMADFINMIQDVK